MRLLLFLLAGCSAPVTEMLVTVRASGLTVGVDINQLHFAATDTTVQFTGFDQTLPLCTDDGGGVPGCRKLPLSVVLYPGSRPADSIRVLVEGQRDGTLVLSNVAVFSFSAGTRQRMDFVLYGSCLNRLDCAGSDTVCDANGQCVHLMTAVDMAVPPGADLASVGGNLSLQGGDLGRDSDGSSGCGQAGQPCCAPDASCGASLGCYNGVCQACGSGGALCCPDPDNLCGLGLACDGSFHCTACGQAGQPCCAGENCAVGVCAFGACSSSCGDVNQPCCGATCKTGVFCSGGGTCVTATCGSGAACCPGSPDPYCVTGSTCFQNSCYACGDYGSQACSNPNCRPPFVPDPFAGICDLCVYADGPCCGGPGGVCLAGLHCGVVSQGVCN